MIAIQIQSIESRKAQISLAQAMGAEAYENSAKQIFVVHENFAGMPVSRSARKLEINSIPADWKKLA